LRVGVLIAVLACVVAFVLASSGGDADATRVVSAGDNERAAPASASLGLAIPQRAGLGEPSSKLFSTPPARKPARVVAAPPPPPAAPPLPYRFAGIVRQGDDVQILVARGDRVIPVKEGDVLDGAYRVASATTEHVELVYVPLGTTQRIAVSTSLDAKPPQARVRASAGASPGPTAAPAVTSRAEAGSPGNARVPSTGAASLRWEGPDQVRAGARVSVALRLTYEGPLRNAPMQLRFEPDVVQPIDVRPGRFLRRGQFSYRVNPEGSIFVGANAEGIAPGADAELLVVTFRPVKAGATAGLSMAALSLQGPAGGAVAYAQLADYRAPILP